MHLIQQQWTPLSIPSPVALLQTWLWNRQRKTDCDNTSTSIYFLNVCRFNLDYKVCKSSSGSLGCAEIRWETTLNMSQRQSTNVKCGHFRLVCHCVFCFVPACRTSSCQHDVSSDTLHTKKENWYFLTAKFTSLIAQSIVFWTDGWRVWEYLMPLQQQKTITGGLF